MKDILELKPQVNTIYYFNDNELKEEIVTSDKRVTLKMAEEYLKGRKIKFDEVLKVIKHDVTLKIPKTDFYDYLVK